MKKPSRTGVIGILLLLASAHLAAAQFTVTFLPESSATYPVGTTNDGNVSQTTNSAGPFSDVACTFKGYDAGGSSVKLDNEYLVYRFRVDFTQDVVLNSFTEIGSGWQVGSFWRVLDTNNNVIFSNTLAYAPNIMVTNETSPNVHGTSFIIDEFDGSSTWRYRQQFVLAYTSLPGLASTLNIALFAGFNMTGTVGALYQIQSVTNAVSTNWVPVTNIVLPASPYFWLDPQPVNGLGKFYRAIAVP
jgi:hypothetical protein